MSDLLKWALLLVLPALASCSPYSGQSSQVIALLEVPEGFVIAPYAQNVKGARSMARSPGGVLYVGSRGEGKVYAITDADNDYKADTVITVARGLRSPNGVAVHDGALYVAEISRILRYDNMDQNLHAPPEPQIIRDDFPTVGHHGWKYIAFGPDDKLYVPVGAPCNVCRSEREIFASITRMNPDGSDLEIIARGVRNSVGFDWHPVSGELWFTDNGRDMMGDNQPPDELNRLTATGQHFGYPYLHGRDIRDPDYGTEGRQLSISFQPPVRALGPHVAALGMLFYTGTMFPAKYKNRLLIAEHGSWNRSTKIGYRITQVELAQNEALSYEPLVEGWLQDNGSVWGRPVDLLQLPDGSVLISDDYGDMIYRLQYQAP